MLVVELHSERRFYFEKSSLLSLEPESVVVLGNDGNEVIKSFEKHDVNRIYDAPMPDLRKDILWLSVSPSGRAVDILFSEKRHL